MVRVKGSPAADRYVDSEPGGREGSRSKPFRDGSSQFRERGGGARHLGLGSGKGERVTPDRLV